MSHSFQGSCCVKTLVLKMFFLQSDEINGGSGHKETYVLLPICANKLSQELAIDIFLVVIPSTLLKLNKYGILVLIKN